MIDDKKLLQWLWFDRAALATGLALAATFVLFTTTAAVGHIEGRSRRHAAWVSSRRLAALPRAAHGNGPPRQLAFRAGPGQGVFARSRRVDFPIEPVCRRRSTPL